MGVFEELGAWAWAWVLCEDYSLALSEVWMSVLLDSFAFTFRFGLFFLQLFRDHRPSATEAMRHPWFQHVYEADA